MDDDDDDLYGTTADAEQGADGTAHTGPATKVEPELVDDEEEDSDDDVQFTLERPEATKSEPASTAKSTTKQPATDTTSTQPAKRARTTAPVKQEATEASVQSTLTHNGKEGKDFPEVRSSTIDTDADPVWPADDKKITDVDIDADLAEHSKPWRLPGTDQTDFFNYGFDEYTWTQYCAKQKSMASTIGDMKDEDSKMKAMLGGASGDGNVDFMAMMQAMMGGGGQNMADPSKMDFSQFPMMNNMGGMQMGGFGQQSSASPMPQQGGQAFQPPSGPSAQQGHSMDYGQPQEQQGGRRGRRGRGGYNNF